mmetsp:Transcript_35892/g.48913  ORF Transcript_35892/g.48913 Transcript_35892/m.48913 type:complete len:96 (-) Transcript_35892:183-470(-)
MEKFFLFGLVCYFTSSILVVWLLFEFEGSVTVSSIFGVLLVWLFCKSRKIYTILQPDKFTSGHVNFNRVKNIGELMGDTSLSADAGVSARFASHI